MQRHLRTIVLLSVVALISGCSIAGTWKTVKTDPADQASACPSEMVTFNDEGGYTATGQHGGEAVTSTGTYEWDGFKLTVKPAEGETRVYPGHYDAFTSQLVLTHKMDDKKTTAWMEKAE
jgi:hypothetical protein